jgi:uncharacterized membrane protein (UPF0127 family)
MIFLFRGQSSSRFYMKNTLIPLSIVFVRDGRVVSTAEMTPCQADPCPTYAAAGPYSFAVEAPARTFAPARPGDLVVLNGATPQPE